MSPRKFK